MKDQIRWVFVLALCFGANLCASAQQSAMECAQQSPMEGAQQSPLTRAQQLYSFVLAGQGDSIHVRLADNLREKIAPVVFSDTFRSLEKQFGKVRSTGEWKTDTIGGMTIYYCDVTFDKYAMRFTTAFDADGKVCSLTFTPVPEQVDTKVVRFDTLKIKEEPIEVCDGKFRLPGTLTLPKEGKNFPVLILVHGSGPNDRDETLGPNKPFRDLAWGLAEQGVAVIRYDKRTKVYGAASIPQGRELDYDTETVDDVLAAIRLAKTLPGVDAARIYVLGHSLGGLLIPRIAERAGDGTLAGVVVLAGAARKMKELLMEQITYIHSLTGQQADVSAEVEKRMRSLPPSYLKMEEAYQPVEVAQKLKLPILILQGERDYQVTMQDFGLWRMGLFRNRNVEYKSYPKLNHLLQEGSGKSTPFEYNHASPVPMYIMEDIAAFINRN